MKVKFHLNKQHNPHSEDGMRVMYGSAKRSGYQIRWYLILALVVSPLLAMAYYLYRTEFLVIAPAIITSYPVTITSTEKAIVSPLPSEVGKSVVKGQTVMLLSNDQLDSETRFIEQELLKLSPPAVKISPIYNDAINQSEQNLQKFELIKRNYDTFRKQGHVSDVDYASIISINNTLNNQLNNQKLAYIEAQRHLNEIALAGPVSQAHRALMQELVIKRSQQDNLTVRSPFDGRVIDIHVLEGERIDINRPLITVAKNSSPEVIAYLNPKYIKYGQIGTKAKVSFPDGANFTATVSKPLEMVNKLPQQLLSPFEGQPAYLRITLRFDTALEQRYWIEGIAVKVQF